MEANSEEFKKFILENREIIESILNEGRKDTEEAIKQKADEAKAKVKDVNDAVLKIVSDDDVQQHFLKGCLEFLHFFEAIIDAAPLSPEVREAVDKFEETRDKTMHNVVATGAKDKIENIKINVKKKS